MAVQFNKEQIAASLLAGLQDVPGSAQAVRELLAVVREVERQGNLTVQPPLSIVDSATGRHIIVPKPKKLQPEMRVIQGTEGLPGRTIVGPQGRTGETGPLGPRGRDGASEYDRKIYILPSAGSGRDIICGVRLPTLIDATTYGGTPLEFLNANYGNTGSMWEASPNPSRVTIKESGRYLIIVNATVSILASANSGDFYYVGMTVGVNGSFDATVPYGEYWSVFVPKFYAEDTSDVTVTVNLPATGNSFDKLINVLEANLSAGDYLELDFWADGITPSSGEIVTIDGLMFVRKIDKAG